ncbi:MAG: hypothetical protein HYX53_13355 [Chloroflexi bacterium]|nr:hypothetical protein [Chloroflexota bacterium]
MAAPPRRWLIGRVEALVLGFGTALIVFAVEKQLTAVLERRARHASAGTAPERAG